MTNTPNTPPTGSSPEVEREANELWKRDLKLSPALRINEATRRRISKLLGSKKAGEMLPGRIWRPDARQISNIYEAIAKTRASFYPHIPKDPNVKLQFVLLGTPNPVPVVFNALVKDPNSKEAHVLAWLYNDAFKSGMDVNILSRLFDRVSPAETGDAQNLLKIKAAVKKLLDDQDKFDIGEQGTENPTPPPFVTLGTGSGQLRGAQERVLQARYDADRALRRKKMQEPKYYTDRVTAAEENLKSLEQRRLSVVKELQGINAAVGRISGARSTWSDAEIQTLAGNIAGIRTSAVVGQNITLRNETKSIINWVDDDDLDQKANSAIQRFRHTGTGLAPSRVVLSDLMRTYFGPRLIGMQENEQERFYSQMYSTLMSEEGAGGEASLLESAPVSGSPRQRPGRTKKVFKAIGRAGKAATSGIGRAAHYLFGEYER